jgi:hypothetical protein
MRFLGGSVLQRHELGHQAREHLVEPVEIRPHEEARGEDDHRRLDRLVAIREVDLGELGADVADEPDEAAEATARGDR